MKLAILTWGNASEVDREAGVFAIKPSGVDYDELTPEEISVVDLNSGEQVGGVLKPSSDTPTHLELYRSFSDIGGVVHTHSEAATSWAQAYCSIPCLGTTHADHFYGAVPCTRPLQRMEVETDYESNTGKVIAEHFAENNLNPAEIPGVLVGGHGPFTWGAGAMGAVTSAIVLEAVAKMAAATLSLNHTAEPVEQFLLDKHYLRKHGSDAYYGQERER
jgi:L-ribulose-5-phosphate 4-epimerase